MEDIKTKGAKTHKCFNDGVGTAAQAAALSQVFQHLTQKYEHDGLPGEVLAYQSVEDRDNVERKQRRQIAKLDLDERQREINSENIAREIAIRDILASISGTVEPGLVESIQRQSRPSHPLQQQIRQRGLTITNNIQEEIDNQNYINKRNRELFHNAIRRAYPNVDPDNLPPGILLPPFRQLAEPFSRYSSLLL